MPCSALTVAAATRSLENTFTSPELVNPDPDLISRSPDVWPSLVRAENVPVLAECNKVVPMSTFPPSFLYDDPDWRDTEPACISALPTEKWMLPDPVTDFPVNILTPPL